MNQEYLSREEIENLEYSDVLKYDEKLGSMYLIVEKVRHGKVFGQTASPIHSGVKPISIDELVKKSPLLGKFD